MLLKKLLGCVRRRVHAHVCVCDKCTHPCMDLRTEDNIGYLSLSLSALVCKTWLFTLNLDLARLASPQVSGNHLACFALPCFYVDSGDLSLIACVTSKFFTHWTIFTVQKKILTTIIKSDSKGNSWKCDCYHQWLLLSQEVEYPTRKMCKMFIKFRNRV